MHLILILLLFFLTKSSQTVYIKFFVWVQNLYWTIVLTVILLVLHKAWFILQIKSNWILQHFHLAWAPYAHCLIPFPWGHDVLWRWEGWDSLFLALKGIWWLELALNSLTACLWHLIWSVSQLVFNHSETNWRLKHLSSLNLDIHFLLFIASLNLFVNSEIFQFFLNFISFLRF